MDNEQEKAGAIAARCYEVNGRAAQVAIIAAALREAKAEAWEDVARFGIEWMKNPGGIDARFIAACRENGAALRVKHEE